jgi:hypothetical protein
VADIRAILEANMDWMQAQIMRDLNRRTILAQWLDAYANAETVSWDIETVSQVHDSVCVTLVHPDLKVEEGL